LSRNVRGAISVRGLETFQPSGRPSGPGENPPARYVRLAAWSTPATSKTVRSRRSLMAASYYIRASKDTGVERPIRLGRTVRPSAGVKAMRAPRVPLCKGALTSEGRNARYLDETSSLWRNTALRQAPYARQLPAIPSAGAPSGVNFRESGLEKWRSKACLQ